MHILHIVNGYGGSEVYKNLFFALDQLGVKQTIFVPLNSNNHKRIANHTIDFCVEGSSVVYSTVRKWYHRFMYDSKISAIKKHLIDSINIKSIDLIHAHTLCLDGAVAYLLDKQFGIPYVFAIRNTDVNIYYKILFWKRNFFKKILLKASNAVFISPAYKKIFSEKIIDLNTLSQVNGKFLLIINGIDKLFLENRNLEKLIHQPVRIIYSGAFERRKNIHSIIKAIDKLISKGYIMNFTAIGLGLPNRKNDVKYINEIRQLAQTRDWIQLENSVPLKELRAAFMNSDILVMPSLTETFGLVYVEALTQGLPILYSRGQGFDGFYEDGEVGYSVDPFDIDDIADKLERVISNYQGIVDRIQKKSFDQFDWNNIAEKYVKTYNNILYKGYSLQYLKNSIDN